MIWRHKHIAAAQRELVGYDVFTSFPFKTFFMTLRGALSFLIMALAFVGSHVSAQDAGAARVRTADGEVVGRTDGPVRTFFGVPFAQAPVGPLRWRPPAPVTAWGGARDATRFGNDCMQPASPLTRLSKAPGTSEDCLTLNVWAPPPVAGKRLPVMVWIYGGSFLGGSASDFDGTALAHKGVIVVAANYRMGLFGFLANAALTAESAHHSSGNYGLLDQLAALRWVKRNVASFGGDPDAVTVFGESSGASAVSLLLTSPLAKGLFSRAILESPGALRPMYALREAEAGDTLIGSDLAAMRAMPAKDILALTERLIPIERSLSRPRALGPIIDGWVVPTDERTAYRTNAVAQVPIIIGGNADEGRLFTQNWPIKTVAQFRDYVGQNFGVRAPHVLQLYPTQQDSDVPAQLSQLFADTQFNRGSDGVADMMALHGLPVYRYRFSHPVKGLPPTHGAEIAFVFGLLQAQASSPADRSLSDAMMDAWVAFARTGNPGKEQAGWARYTPGTRSFMEFGDEPRLARLPRSPRLEFLECIAAHPATCPTQ